MADAVTSQTLIDGQKTAIFKFTNISDGSGESAVKKVDVSALSNNQSGQKKLIIMARKKANMPKRNKKNFRSTKSGAGMTKAGVAAYRRANPGSKLKTAVTGKVKKGSAAAKRRKSFCARSAGQMKKFPKAAKDPNSRLRQARKRWKC